MPSAEPSAALRTDLYELTMAQGYWKARVDQREAIFHLYFRRAPFGGRHAVACGVADALAWVAGLRFTAADIGYLATLTGNDGRPLFDPAFLERLAAFRFTGDIDAVPEGSVVFPGEPLMRVRGPIVEAQILETALLNAVCFQTLVATKAARVCQAAAGAQVIEFGLRRAQGPDGGLSASRAAYVGGCHGTSDVLAGARFGIPVMGTHAHSWVMSFDDELAAFRAWAEAMPNNAVLLVDTYDSLAGVRRAAVVGRELAARGHRLAGVRLDSGDLAYLSVEARRILDEAGLTGARIVASNDLDEHLIASLVAQGAKIDVYGVGTRLVTAKGDPALGGVYKLAAVREPGGAWSHRIKLSEQTAKINTPGMLQVRRYMAGGLAVADVIYDELTGLAEPGEMADPVDPTLRRALPAGPEARDLLQPAVRAGERVARPEPLDAARERARSELAALHPTIRRFDNPHRYPVGLEARLHALKTELILAARRGQTPPGAAR